MAGVGKIAVALIKENPVALRPVNRKGVEYLELVQSIIRNGVLNPIVVREQQTEGGETYYGLIDGLHRFTAAKDAGLEEIAANVVSLDDAEVEEAQIMANIHKVETKPAEYSQQLRRILARNPLMTEGELSKRLAKSPAWLKDRLGLVKLHGKIQELVNDEKVGLSNAYALAKLPEDEQLDFLERAQTQTPTEFVPIVNDRVKALREAKRKGKDATPAEFEPQAFLQRLGEIKAEMTTGDIGAVLISENNLSSAAEGWNMAMRWVLHLDPQSKAAQIAKEEQRKKKLEEEKAARKAERDQKKADEARGNALAAAE